jgi:transcriptional regulator with XRE-family HTH domain
MSGGCAKGNHGRSLTWRTKPVCGQALISSIEHGHANPTRESLDKVASALDVAVADLLA